MAIGSAVQEPVLRCLHVARSPAFDGAVSPEGRAPRANCRPVLISWTPGVLPPRLAGSVCWAAAGAAAAIPAIPSATTSIARANLPLIANPRSSAQPIT